MDLTEAEDIKKRWQEYTELYKIDLHDPDNHDRLITHLEPDILNCKVKWALGRITTNKASGGDGIPIELFQILKDDDVKVLHSIFQQIWKTQQRPQDCFHSNPGERQCQRVFKLPHSCTYLSSVQFITQSCPILCDPMDCSTPGFPVHHQLPEFTQTHIHRVSDAIQPAHPLPSPSPLTFNLSQHQGLFQ